MINIVILLNDLQDKLSSMNLTKPIGLVPVNGKYVVERLLDSASSLDVSEVVVAAGSMHAKQVIDFFSVKLRPHALHSKVKIFIENERRGTGGAIKYAMERFKDATLPVLVLHGDVLAAESFDIFVESLPESMQAHFMGVEVSNVSDYGLLEVNHRNEVLSFLEKSSDKGPGLVNSGIYILMPSCLKLMHQSGSFSIEKEVFPRLSYASVFRSKSAWTNMGSVEDFHLATKLFR